MAPANPFYKNYFHYIKHAGAGGFCASLGGNRPENGGSALEEDAEIE